MPLSITKAANPPLSKEKSLRPNTRNTPMNDTGISSIMENG